MTTHESSVFSNRPVTRHDPAKIALPPYHPDTPIIRNKWAHYYDNIQNIMNHIASKSCNLPDARWISIRPDADERRQTLAEAKWIGPAATSLNPDDLFAIGVEFEIPSDKKVVSAVLDF